MAVMEKNMITSLDAIQRLGKVAYLHGDNPPRNRREYVKQLLPWPGIVPPSWGEIQATMHAMEKERSAVPEVVARPARKRATRAKVAA